MFNVYRLHSTMSLHLFHVLRKKSLFHPNSNLHFFHANHRGNRTALQMFHGLQRKFKKSVQLYEKVSWLENFQE